MSKATDAAKAVVSSASSMLKAAARITNDGWLNIITGLGTHFKDKRMHAWVKHELMPPEECEQLYGADDLSARIVDAIPEDALREWITPHFDDADGGQDLAKDVLDKLDDLGARHKLAEAWTWGRLYGGGAVLMVVDDSKDLSEPLDLGAIRDLQGLVVLTSAELRTTTSLVDLNLMSPRYGLPFAYIFQPHRGGTEGTGQHIHYTRLLRFEGVRLPPHLYIRNHYWGDSVLNRAKNAIRNYNTGHDALASVLQEFNQGVFKMQGLADMLLNGQDDAVQARLETIQLARSICRAVVIDAEGEDFTNVGAAITGVPEALAKLESRVVVAANMPHDKVLGDSPSGLGATGESENRNWYDYVDAQRKLVLKPKIDRLLEIILSSRKGPTAGVVPDNYGFEFDPLWQMDEGELADIRNKQAQTDVSYINAGVVDPDEVAVSRFGTGKYSTETTIDLEARDKGDAGAGPADPSADPAAAPGAAPANPPAAAPKPRPSTSTPAAGGELDTPKASPAPGTAGAA